MPIEVKRLCHTYLAGTEGEEAAMKDAGKGGERA